MEDKELNSEVISEKITKEEDFDPQQTKIDIKASQLVEVAHKYALEKIGNLSKLTIKGSLGNTALNPDGSDAYIPRDKANIEFIYLKSKPGFTNMISNAFKKFKTDGVFSRYLMAFTGDEDGVNLGPDALLIGTYSDKTNIYYVCPYKWSIGNTSVPTSGVNGSIKKNIDNIVIPVNNSKNNNQDNQQSSKQDNQQNQGQSGQQNTSGQNTSGQSSNDSSPLAGMQLASTDPKIKFNKPIVNESDRIYLEKMIFEKIINDEKNK